MTIYNPDSTIFKEVVLLDGSMMTNGIRENHDVTLCFSSEEELAIPEGAYVVFNGETFIAKSKSKMEMSHTRSYTYTIKMNGAPSALSSVRLRNPADGKLSFPYTASAHDHLALIVSNMNRYGGGGWVVGDCIYGGEKFLQYNYISCRDALDSLADTYGTEWEIVGKTISLHKVEYNFDSPLELSYGKGSGLRPGIIRDNVQTPMTRLYTQGGSKNIDASEYGSTILLLPKSVTFKYDGNKFEDEQGFDETKARIYSTDSEGTYIKSHKNEDKDVNEGVIDCTDIYPNKLHTVLEVESGDNPRDIVLDIDEDLDYSQYQIAGEIPTITFQSGELMGKTFEIRRDQGGIIMVSKKYSAQGSFVGWKLTLSGTFESGRWLPDSQSGLVPAVGDTCRIFGVRMPSQYICDNNTKSGASWDMLRRGIMYLFECEDYIYSLKMPVDPIWARANWGSVGSKFVAGGYVRYSNSGWAQGGVIMRIKTIRQDISHPYSIEVSLSNGIVGGGVLKGLSDSISNQAGSISEQQDTQKKLEYNVSSLSGNYVTVDTEQTITAPKTFAEDVTFGAAREDGTYSRLLIPSSSGPGIYDLFISTQPVSGEVPSGSGGIDEDELWTILGTPGTQQIGAGHLTDALAPYATQSWVQQRGYLTSVGVSDIGGLGEGWASLLGSAPDFYSKSQVYSKSEADSRFVTLATEQIISGKKSFTALLTASAGISSTDADLSGYVSASKLYVPFSGNNKKYDILISNTPFSGEAPSGSGGIDEDELWTILSNGSGDEVISVSFLPALASLEGNLDWSRIAGKPQWIGSSKPSYSYTEITGLGDQLATYARKDGSNATGTWGISISGDAATLGGVSKGGLLTDVTSTSTTNLSVVVGGKTISVAGLYAAYADRLLSDVSLWGQDFNGSQDVSGDMSGVGDIGMSGDITGAVNADFSGYVASEKLYLPYSGGNKVYDLCISTQPVSGEAPTASGGIDEDELWNILATPGTLTGQKIDASHLPSLSGMNGTLPWNMVSGKPSTYAPSAHEHEVTDISDLGMRWFDVLVSNLDKGWSSALRQPKPNWLEQTQAELGGYIPVHGDEDYWIATDSHTHDIDEIGGMGTGWAAALTAAKPSWLTSVPVATDSAYGGFKTGYPEATGSRYYAVELNTLGQAYVHVPWTDTNTTYTLASFGITATAGEINKLDGVTATTAEINYLDGVTSSIQTQLNGKVPTSRTINGIALSSNITLDGADIKLTGYTEGSSTAVVAATDTINAALAKLQNQIQTKAAASSLGSYLPKAGGTMTGDITMSGCSIRIPQSPSALSYDGILNADGSKAILAYYGESTYTGLMTGTHYLRSGATSLIHRRNGTDYTILDTYNYSSHLDSRYVNVSGDTMTGTLNINSSSEAFIRYQISGSNKAATGYLASQGAYLYSYPANKYLHITDSGSLLFGSSTVWHSGNDGPGSGLNADQLDGYQASSFLLKSGGTMTGNLTLKSMGGMWLGGKTQAPIMTSGASSTSGNTYHPVIWGKTDAGDVWNLGHGASDQVGFFGFYSERTANGTDWAHYIKVSDGTVHFNKTVYGTTFSGTLSGNATSATKLQTSRTIWGRPFDGTGNVSGAISSTGNITPSAAGSYNIGTASLWYERIYGRYIDTASGYNLRLCSGGVEHLSIQASSGNVGIGTTSPSYKFHVVGAAYISSTLTLGAGITGVSTITGDGFTLGTNSLKVYDSTSKANRITANWSNSIARIYAIDEAGNNYRDLSLGQTQGNSASLYFDASAARWGIGTTSPAYKLDVAGTLRATDGAYVKTLTISSTGSEGHLIFSRANYNYITAPSGGYISFNTNGVGTGSAVSDLVIHAHQLFPGTTNAVTFGVSTRRWSNVYSVLGNFSGLVTAGSIAVTDKLYIPSSSGNNVFDAYIA